MNQIINLEELLRQKLPTDEFVGEWVFKFMPTKNSIACINRIECGEGDDAQSVEFTVQVGINNELQLCMFDLVKISGGVQSEYHLARQYDVKTYVQDYFKNLEIV